LLAVGLLTCSMPNERALSGFVRVGQVNIEHETGVVKNDGALFRCWGVACAVASLHVAPTEVECVDYSKSDAKTVVHGSNARPYCEACDPLLSSLCPPAPAGINGTTDHGEIANESQAIRRFANCSEPCQGVAWHPCPAHRAGEASEAESWRPATQMPVRQLGRRTIRSWSTCAVPLSKCRVGIDTHAKCDRFTTAAKDYRAARCAQKNAVPLLVGPGLRGGRWPEAHVERDGERCYCGRGWVLPAPNSTATAATLGGTAGAFFGFLIALRDFVTGGSRQDADFQG
jgi:hypothetical protein